MNVTCVKTPSRHSPRTASPSFNAAPRTPSAAKPYPHPISTPFADTAAAARQSTRHTLQASRVARSARRQGKLYPESGVEGKQTVVMSFLGPGSLCTSSVRASATQRTILAAAVVGIGIAIYQGFARRWIRLLSGSSSRHVRAFASTDASCWKYLAEGALNLTCKYVGDDPLLVGHVLRLRKHNPEASKGASRTNPYLEGRRFEEKVILPLLGRRYVQPSFEVPLKQGFVQDVAQRIEKSRPEWRRIHGLDPLLSVGLLMTDNTALPAVPGDVCVCAEIKVKCGYLPSSPWVTHEVKRRVSAFQMHQQLKLAKGKETVPSRYGPVDLFSADEGRVRKALTALVEVPQNNLQVFVNGKLLFPKSHSEGGFDALTQVLQDAANYSGSAEDLLDVLVGILQREPLLPRLLAAQMLDDCDVEVAGKVYKAILARGGSIPPLANGPPLVPGQPRPESIPGDDDLEGQQELVRRFLVSKTAKDCSVMITLKPDAASVSGAASSVGQLLRSLPIKLVADRTVVRGFRGYAYSIAAVDLDPKPQRKMPHYLELDEEMALTYDKLERSGKLL